MKVRDFIKTMDPEQEIILFKGNSTLNGIWKGRKNDDITDDILDYKVENVKASMFADRHLVLFVFVSEAVMRRLAILPIPISNRKPKVSMFVSGILATSHIRSS